MSQLELCQIHQIRQGQLLSLTRFVDQPERLSNARKALRGGDEMGGTQWIIVDLRLPQFPQTDAMAMAERNCSGHTLLL